MTGTRRPAAVWTSGGLAAALSLGLAVYLAPLDPGVLALQLCFTPQCFSRVVHAWSPSDLARYQSHLPVDGLLLLAYGAFGPLLVWRSAVFRASGQRVRRLAAAAMPAAAACDAAENLLHAWLTAAPRFGMRPLYAVSGGMSTAKWLLLLLFAGLVVQALLSDD